MLNLFTDAGLNFFLHAGQFRFAHKQGTNRFQPRQLVKLFEYLLAVFDLAEHIGGNHIRQLTGVLNFQNGLHRLSGDAPAHLAVFFKIMVCRAQKRVRLNGNGRSGFLYFIQRAHKEGLFLRHRAQNGAAFALHEQADIFARQSDYLLDAGNRTHMINIVNRGIIHIHIALRDQKNALILRHGLLKRRNRFFAAHIKMQHHMRKDHQPPQRQHRQADRLCFILFRLSQCLFPPLSVLFS